MWSTYRQQFHLNIKYKKDVTNHVEKFPKLTLIVVLTTSIKSYGHETTRWLQSYNTDFNIIATN